MVLAALITLELASCGYAVVLSYARDPIAADRVVDQVLAGARIATAVRGDVADYVDIERLFAETAEAFGGVDVVVHTIGETARDGSSSTSRQRERSVRAAQSSTSRLPCCRGRHRGHHRDLAREVRDRDITGDVLTPGDEPSGSALAIAKVVAFLVSHDGHWVNGQVIGHLD